MRMKGICWLWILLGLLASVVAQPSNGSYRIQPEDVLRIQVYQEAQVQADVPVGKDGNISAPFVGTIMAAGKTTSELEQELVEAYRRALRIREPRVSVIIVRYRVLRASVGGFVNRPGAYEIRPGDTLIALLNQGGGPVPDRADLRRATLRRGNSRELIPIDLYSMLIKADTSQNYLIEDGDELIVPEETRNRILVLGQVARPGVYSYKEPMTLADAISQAGGEIPTRSWFSKTMVMRERPGMPGQYIRIEADFVRFIRKGDATQNVTLLPGDLVYVPEVRTPDLNRIGNTLNSLLFFDRFFRDGIFGFRLFR